MALLCGLNFARPAPTVDSKVALVIGNSNYKAVGLSLPNAVRDAKTVADALTKDGFTVTLKYDLTRDDFEAALADFNSASQNADISLFYYAGHGVQYRGQNYLLTTDNIPHNNQDIKFKSVPMKDVVDAASDARKAKIIILDACRNSKPDPGNPGSRSVTGVGDGTGLAAVDGSHGLVVFYSAQHGKQALDAGPFAPSIAKHIVEPGRDLKDVFTEVANDVRSETQAGQEPEIVTASLTEPIVLNPEDTPEAAWHKILRSGKAEDAEVLKDFIKRFPDSDEADSAQTKLDKIDLVRRAQEQEAEEAKRAAANEAANKERERQEAARLEADRQLKAKEEAEQAAREKQLADLLAQKQAADAAIAAQLKKTEEDRERIAAQVQAERAKLQQAEAEAKQRAEAAAKAQADAEAAKRLAQQEIDAQQREAARLDADKKAREAEAADEAVRQAQAEIAKQKLAEDARRRQALLDEKAEQDRLAKITADACASDMAQLEKYKQARQSELIQSLLGQSRCPTLKPAADQAVKEVAAAMARTCEAEQKKLATIDVRNEASLNSALDSFTCQAVRKATTGLLAKLEEDKQRMATACADDRVAINAIDPSIRTAKSDLLALRAKAVCPDTPKAIDVIVSAIDERVTSAQADLIRLACLDKASGAFDEATANAVTKYLRWTVTPGSCATLIREALANRFVYLYATNIESVDLLPGTVTMCVDVLKFQARGAADCWRRGLEAVNFAEIDTRDARDWTTFLTEPGK